MTPANAEIKIAFSQAGVNKLIKRVPCSDGTTIANVPPGMYRMALSLAPAGDPTKSGMEYAVQDVNVPDQGITVNAEMAQADARFTWVVANVPMCQTAGSTLSVTIDRTKIVNAVACSAGGENVAVPALSKDLSITAGPVGQTTTYAKTVAIPRTGGNVALPIP
jgi:hypothetical protein